MKIVRCLSFSLATLLLFGNDFLFHFFLALVQPLQFCEFTTSKGLLLVQFQEVVGKTVLFFMQTQFRGDYGITLDDGTDLYLTGQFLYFGRFASNITLIHVPLQFEHDQLVPDILSAFVGNKLIGGTTLLLLLFAVQQHLLSQTNELLLVGGGYRQIGVVFAIRMGRTVQQSLQHIIGIQQYVIVSIQMYHELTYLLIDFTNLLTRRPFSNPAPKPLNLLLPICSTVSVRLKGLSLPILNYKQLSFLMFLTCLLCSLPVVKIGDYPISTTLSRDSNISNQFSCVSYSSLKQGWFNACSAVIRSSGFIFSIFLSRSIITSSVCWYSGLNRLKLQSLFSVSTSLQVFPLKTLLPNRSRWKIRPRLKISQLGEYLVLISLILMISGATQPGVPHRTNRYSSLLQNQASPQSAITQSSPIQERSSMFSGLRSRCIMFLECISLSPQRMPLIIFLI